MAKDNRRVMLVSADQARSHQWSAALSALGRQPLTVGDPASAMEKIPEFLPALLFLHIDANAKVADVSLEFDQRCKNFGVAVITIMANPTPNEVGDCFRRGTIDVLLEPFDLKALEISLGRAATFRSLYQENIDYRKQLERANRELKESLNILRMDQLAGRQVQLNLLPQTPFRCGEYEVAHRIVPSLYLSGDFVGYNSLFDRYLLFYFADVSGHGASSAFVTVMLGFILRQVMRRHIADDDLQALSRAPEGLLEHINRQILAMGLDKHLTIFVGAIDTHANVLRYAVGAQVPMPILLVNGKASFLAGKGKPVGLFEDAHWQIEQLELPKTFSLVVVSDGLLDCLSGTSWAEKQSQLLTAIEKAGHSHSALCAELGIDEIKAAPDDVSIVMVTRSE